MFIQTLNKKNKIKNQRSLACPLKTPDKRAVSEIIGYILLITFAIVIAGVVYQWLKTYVPKEGIACPDGVSIYVSEYAFDKDLKELSLTLKNNGQFSIGGIFIHYSTDKTQEIAVNDLSASIIPKNKYLNPGIALGEIGENSFEPNSEDIKLSFDMSQINYIYAIEITPIRWQEEKNKKQIVSCANAKTKKDFDITLSENDIFPLPKGLGIKVKA